MKVMVFTEGTVLLHKSGEGLPREEVVEQSKKEGIQREEASINYNSKYDVPVEPDSVHDYGNYIPNGDAVDKLNKWKKEGATIYYLSSRRIKKELDAIRNVLKKYKFPDAKNLLYRKQGENYRDVVERNVPEILIEDNCESIGGDAEMTYTQLRDELKKRIRSVVVKEFAGIDHLPDDLAKLAKL
jgi:hypothetical protein